MRSRSPQNPAAGDIVVMKVGSHYHVCRAQADGDHLAPIQVVNDLADALALACRTVTGHQRVVLYDRAGSADCVLINCAKLQ
jgi:hypothetical protein